MQPVIITCAVCGSRSPEPAHLEFPRSPREVADSAVAAARAGAAIVHVHARDDEGRHTREVRYFAAIVERIAASGTDVIVNLTAGGGARYFPDPADESRAGPGTDMADADSRLAHVRELRPEMCSLDVTTHARSRGPDEYVYLNTPRTLRAMARRVQELGVKPELEVFQPGDVVLARELIDDGLVNGVPLIQFVLGVRWTTPADPASLIYLRTLLPEPAQWSAMGTGARQFPVAATAAMLGGHVRVGLEDNVRLDRDRYASNAQLVERAAQLVRWLGREPASAAEARRILGLRAVRA